MRDVQVPIPTGPFYTWGRGAGEALSTAGRPNLVQCAPNGNVVGPGPPVIGPSSILEDIPEAFFNSSKVVVCGEAGSLGSGARGVIGRCCRRLLRSSHDWTARLTSRLGSKADDRPGCIYLLLLPLGWATRLDWTGAQTAVPTMSVLFVQTTYKRIP
jgi:hypothetical protein